MSEQFADVLMKKFGPQFSESICIMMNTPLGAAIIESVIIADLMTSAENEKKITKTMIEHPGKL